MLSATTGEVAPLRAALEDAVTHGDQQAGAGRRPASWWERTTGKLAGADVVLAATGVGKANAAAAAALALAELRPSHVVLVGIGGAYAGSGLGVGEVALAASETHVDSGVGYGASWEGLDAIGFPLLETDPPSFNRLWFDQRFIARLSAHLGVRSVPFATSESVTAEPEHAAWLEERHGVAIESMEGGAVAQVALAFGVPLVELRGTSNVVGVRDKSRWQVRTAVANACEVALRAFPLLGAG